MRAAGIIFSNLNDNTLSRLTAERTVAAIPFACRYNLVDFALSNMIHSGIVNISVVANYNYRSLSEHIGSGKDWDLARRSGGIRMISPYQTSKSAHTSMYSYRLEALKSMSEYIMEMQEENVVLSDCDNICNLDLKKIINHHKLLDADITFVTAPCSKTFTSKSSQLMLDADENGKVRSIARGKSYIEGKEQRFIGIYVMKTLYLRKVLDDAFAYNYNSMTEDILMHNTANKKFYTYLYEGYVAPVSSFLDYFTHSIELTEKPEQMKQLLMNRKRPVFTRVHNSAPCTYKEGASVKSSLIADDCLIEGTVENSILFRGVKVAKGAVVRNSVLFAGTYIGQNSNVNCIVTDKNVTIGDNCNLSGSRNLPFYISRGRNV